jgi:hypothetical protein
MFIVYPTNVDYLIQDVRMHIGDFGDKQRFSDSVIRAAIIGGIKMLQRRWANRYLVFTPAMYVSPLPEGVDFEYNVTASGTYSFIIPSGMRYARLPEGFGVLADDLTENDVFRNPNAAFLDPEANAISQEDEFPVVLAASVVLRKSQLSSNAEVFQSWSDGEFTFSNLGSQRALSELYLKDAEQLDSYFKKRLSGPVRSHFGKI